MMSNKAESPPAGNDLITIQPVGLEDNELRMLKSLCTISSIASGSRNRKYALANPGEDSHIYLIDAKKPTPICAGASPTTPETPRPADRRSGLRRPGRRQGGAPAADPRACSPSWTSCR